jgi:L-seryl-tRNA(Ser) seleniumtransferase
MSPAAKKELLRKLPSVTALLEHDEVQEWLHGMGRPTVVAALQTALDHTRRELLDEHEPQPPDVQDILARAEEEMVRRSMPSIRRVINATGIVLHTGLGRAPLSDAAIEAIVEGASGYCNLEFDLATAQRGQRTAHVARLLAETLGAEAATVVNNNAAATLLILQTFAAGREVIVSRGQLIEIGGSFRLPDIMRAGGATLREVGTTNRTRLSDYENAIGPATAMLMRVHTSNYRVVGFTEEVEIADLAELAHCKGLLAFDDLGSGVLIDPALHGLPPEPLVIASIAAGADILCFSGDKLLGGPQCGIIAGRKDLIEQLHANPLMRTYRVDKLTLLALDATLRHYGDPQDALQNIPTLAMLSATTDELAARARSLVDDLKAALPQEQFFLCSDVGFAGGGAMPGHELPTVVVHWRPANLSADDAARALRDADTPVVARIRDNAICFDLRTLRPVDFEALVSAVFLVAYPNDRDGDENSIRLPVL